MAKKALDARGGTDGLKQDAEKLRDIATGPGTAKEKAKAAGDALREPPAPPTAPEPPASAPAPAPVPAAATPPAPKAPGPAETPPPAPPVGS